MRDFNYIIIGGGCAGLSLAYELEIYNKLKDKTLAIVETRQEYKRDKTWSFWKVAPHNFEDCVIKSWTDFSINIPKHTNFIKCGTTPYQSIDSGLFYEKILNRLRNNKNINFLKNLNDINSKNSIVFNSVLNITAKKNNVWQHFGGAEIQTEDNIFDDEIMNLMDFDCDQKNSVHFFYTLPFSKNRALVETTWLSNMSDLNEKNYDLQIEEYLKYNLKIKNFKIIYREEGKIPLFYPEIEKNLKEIYIGTAGGMTRLSTGYTFLNIQEHSRYISKNLQNIKKIKNFEIKKKYKFLDEIFLRVLLRHPENMPEIFYKMFMGKNDKIIKFLSNKSNILDDLSVILKMPKMLFIKELIQ